MSGAAADSLDNLPPEQKALIGCLYQKASENDDMISDAGTIGKVALSLCGPQLLAYVKNDPKLLRSAEDDLQGMAVEIVLKERKGRQHR